MNLLIAVCLGIFVYTCVLMLFYKKGSQVDSINKRLSSITNCDKKNYRMDEDLEKPLMERFIKPLLKKQMDTIIKFIPGIRKNTKSDESKKQRNNKLKKMLSRAGLSIGVSEFCFIRFAAMAGMALAYVAVALISRAALITILLAVFFGIYSGYAGMRYYLTFRIAKRKKAMEQQLPDVLDLLSVSVEAGLGFEQAIYQIVSHFEGPLIDELAVTYREMSMGRTRRDALLLLGERCDLEEMKSFVGALVQASQLGISMKNVLRAQSTAMRQARRNKIEEKAMKISVKILVPMVVFIFPVIFIVLLGPAAINIMKVLG